MPFLAAVFAIQCAMAQEASPGKPARQGIFRLPPKQEKKSAEARLLQQEMMDFSDRYTMAVWQALDEYIRRESDPLKRSAAEHWKVLFSSASMEIAVGREPAATLLDMAVFIDLSDWAASRYWVPEVFGPGANALLRAHRMMRQDLDVILGRVLTAEQLSELSAMISSYKRAHPNAAYVADVRLRDLATQRAGNDRGNGGIPLLAEVRKAVGDMDEALQYGERLMFYVERVTRLTTMQTALALAQIGSSPAVLSLTRSAETAASAVDRLPTVLTSAIEGSGGTIKEILPEVHATATEARAATESAERIMKLLGDAPSDDPWTPSKTQAALAEARQAAGEINQTLRQLESTLAGISMNEKPASYLLLEAGCQARKTLDHGYEKLLVLICIFWIGQVLVVLLAAKAFRRR